MALVKCKECGKEISEKSNSCIHCGSSLKENCVCPECGEKMTNNKCPNCGFELNNKNRDNKVESVTVTGTNNKRNKVLYIICGVIVGIALLWGGYYLISDLFSSFNKYDRYYNAKISSCPEMTLKQGLEKYAAYVTDEKDYKIYEAVDVNGKTRVYLSFYGYYSPLTILDGEVSSGSVYSEGYNTLEYGDKFLDEAICAVAKL